MRFSRRRFGVIVACASALGCAPAAQRGGTTAQESVDALLAADRRHAAAAQRAGRAEAIAGEFARDVILQAGPGFVRGRDSVRAAMARGPAGVPYWEPVRGGVSADGQHGYTLGYLSIAGDTVVSMKYLAYWTRVDGEWRVRVYRRIRAQSRPARIEMIPTVMPVWGVTLPDAATAAQQVRDAESAFSARAGVVGLRQAFAEFGTADAINMGGSDRPGFVVGAVAIADLVSAGSPPGPSPLTWGSDEVIAAPSGDLGISIGHINIPGPPAARVPFFTIWRRDGVGRPWRYIAE